MVKKGDLAGASAIYDSLRNQQAPDDSAEEIQDLSRLALGRILYERSQFDKAIDMYQSIPRQSKYFAEALDEQAWTYIKAKEWQKAWRSVDLLLLSNPDMPDAPDKRLLLGNLQLRIGNFNLAHDEFRKVREEFDPIQRQLKAVIVRAQTDPGYFDNLVGRSLEKFDISVFVPPAASKWVKAEPDVARMISLASDVGDLQRDLQSSAKFRTVGISIDVYSGMGAAVNALPGGEIVAAMDRGLLDAAEFNNATSDRVLGFPDVSKVCMLQSYHQNAEQFEITFNKDKYNALPEKMKAIIANAVDAASADMSWKAIDRYSKDYVELQAKDNVKFYKTPDAILKQQLEIYDGVVKKKAAENPLFKEIVQSQIEFAKRATQWEQDTVVSRRMAYDHYFGANAAAKKL